MVLCSFESSVSNFDETSGLMSFVQYVIMVLLIL